MKILKHFYRSAQALKRHLVQIMSELGYAGA